MLAGAKVVRLLATASARQFTASAPSSRSTASLAGSPLGGKVVDLLLLSRPSGENLVAVVPRLRYNLTMQSTVDIRRLTRRTIIDMALRRQRPGSGSGLDFLMQRTTTVQWPDLTLILAPIHWAVVGAAATRLYMPERMTKDLDIAIAVQEADFVRRKLALAGYIRTSELSIGGSRWQAPDGLQIDVIEGHDAWWPQALAAAQLNRDEQGLPILPLSYLILMKFSASRTIDLGDITRMLGLASEANHEQVRTLFRLYAPADLDDLESLILLGKLETGRLNE